ncbi:MAG: response regulator transcription factor [Tissierellia bacterium]|nr:response regulator transcription factor [Tissierellia bacterium]
MLVDDHELIREGIKQILELENDIDVISQVGSGVEAIDLARRYKPDIILLDINMPEMNGIEVLKRLRDLGIESKVIMLTIYNDREYILETMKIGAEGYVLKDSDAEGLVKAIRDVNAGKTYIQPSIASLLIENGIKDELNEDLKKINSLTKREYEVLTLIAEGLSNKDIADRLFISEKTVKNHVSSIFKKIEVNDRIQAAIFAFKNNIKKL